jgi:hypothetical protein
VEEQAATIAQLKQEMQSVAKRLNEQATQLQKVSAEVELNKGVSRLVLKNQ